ncbi:hypothetical protein [Paenibacillus arenilitoris]|uniref:Uncharacterized protein n=1 Tax=Paenibacillus arenilitoris TaxID=2772299 RepID=A0A927CLA1_9BACL|nr:hypothetical protein [Paenibacillus arenilitoris]MBD2869277.1 hypothetical protein [Paenibacillus arenilitoris]
MPHKGKDKGNNDNGSSRSDHAAMVSLLNQLAIGQVVDRVNIDSGASIVGVKWNGLAGGNANFVAAPAFKISIPVHKIISIELSS